MARAALLSGGVDSPVALRLALEKDAGNIAAYYLKIWLEDEVAHLGECPWEEDLAYARRTCEQAGVPLEVIPLQAEYLERVVTEAIEELRQGRTPSPDIWCNQRIKFGAFLDAVGDRVDRVISGHYARVDRSRGTPRLLRSPDPVKDQTYFLCALSRDQLDRIDFPIGHLAKDEVRRLARDFDLPTKARPDSQGICFLGKIRYPEFVRFHLGEREGPIVDRESGDILGTHDGFWFYTIGQRQGLGLAGGPWYVVAKDTDANTVFVSRRRDPNERGRSSYVVSGLNWIGGEAVEGDLRTKLRHGPRLADCWVEATGEDAVAVTLKECDAGIASGQWSVFYRGEECLGGGIID